MVVNFRSISRKLKLLLMSRDTNSIFWLVPRNCTNIIARRGSRPTIFVSTKRVRPQNKVLQKKKRKKKPRRRRWQNKGPYINPFMLALDLIRSHPIVHVTLFFRRTFSFFWFHTCGEVLFNVFYCVARNLSFAMIVLTTAKMAIVTKMPFALTAKL